MKPRLAAATCLVLSTLAGAAQADERAEAEKLFREALAEMDAGKAPSACPKLERSQALDPALGTQFELAVCYEQAGRLPEASDLLERVKDLAHQAGKAKLEAAAGEKLRAVSAHVGKLVVRGVPAGATLRLDGKAAPPEVTLVPGTYKVEVTMAASETWSTSVTVVAARSTEVVAPPLHRKEPLPAVAPPRESPAPAKPAPVSAPSEGRSTVAYVGLGVAAVGAAALGMGFGLGAVAASKNSDSKAPDACGADNRCSPAGFALREDAIASANLATVLTVAGGVAAAGGLAVFFLAPKRVSVAASPTASGAWASLRVTY